MRLKTVLAGVTVNTAKRWAFRSRATDASSALGVTHIARHLHTRGVEGLFHELVDSQSWYFVVKLPR
jgi:hypothetical protein